MTRRLLAPLALAVTYVLAALLVDPRGEFPLNDDWSFALSTWRSLEQRSFQLAMFSGMALKTQIVWGALWTLVFGESFWVLRLSTMFLSLAALLILERWLYVTGWPLRVRAAAALTLLAHPIFFWSSFTYMTHVPFLFCSLVAVVAADLALRRDDGRLVVVVVMAVFAAFSLRQTGVALAIALVSGAILDRGRSRIWRFLGFAGGACALIFAVLYTTTNFLHGNLVQMEAHSWGDSAGEVIESFASATALTPARAIINFALFALPLVASFVFFGRWSAPGRVLFLLLALPFLLAPASCMVGTLNAIPTPSHGDILENFGLGPHTLRDVWTFRQPYPLHVGMPARIAITYGAAVLGAAWLVLLVAELRDRYAGAASDARRNTVILLASSAVWLTIFLVPGMIYFDRHSLDALWMAIPLTAMVFPWSRPAARNSFLVLLAVMLAFCIGATQEYFSWNRARWTAFGLLKERGVRLEQMDGGFEINQYLLGGFDGPQVREKAGMSVIDDEYILSFGPVSGYSRLARVGYSGYFGLMEGHVWVLKREEGFRFE